MLLAWRSGDDEALHRLVPLVHDELKRIARNFMARERAGHSMQPTALVNEAYLRMIDVQRVQWQNRAHFLAVAARMMRRILVDHARSKGSQKRGGGIRVSLEEFDIADTSRSAEVLALDDALRQLAEIDERKSKVVELRFFGGLSVEETGAVLGVSPETVMRDWKVAKDLLQEQIRRG